VREETRKYRKIKVIALSTRNSHHTMHRSAGQGAKQ